MSKERSQLLLVTLVLVLQGCVASASLEDNKILGQPEEVLPLGLPTDEESFNQLSVFFDPSKVSGTGPVGSGTYQFVSSTFPEVDARGFHESVFDGIGDYFPSWPTSYKRGADSYPASPTLAQRLGLQPRNKFRKRSEQWVEPPKVRKKRAVSSQSNSSQELTTATGDCGLGQCEGKLAKRQVPTEEGEHERKFRGSKDGDWKSKTVHPGVSEKRSGARYVRGMEMGSSGFHGDVFNGDFGDFMTMRKRARGSLGFHGDTFSDGFGDFTTMKRALKKKRLLTKIKELFNTLAGNNEAESENDARVLNSSEGQLENGEELHDSNSMMKRKPEMTSMGFHDDTFNGGFGAFYPVKKRRPEMDSMGFHGDTFSRGFGEFEPFKKRRAAAGSMGFHGDTFSQGFGDFDTYKKRRPEMDSSGFHGDTFSRGFGEFEPFKKRRPLPGAMGFHGDTFSQGFGDFDTYKKRRPEMDSMGFHGDTFNRGFGEFEPLKKRRPLPGSSGFHGDTFSQGFGDFDTYKKRRPEMDSMGFHGDTFTRGFGEFEPLKKRRPAGSMGFHGDTFSQGFGDFDTYKKRRPEMDSMGFHGDTFNRGFGDFEVYKKKSILSSEEQEEVHDQTSKTGKLEDKLSCTNQRCGSLRL